VVAVVRVEILLLVVFVAGGEGETAAATEGEESATAVVASGVATLVRWSAYAPRVQVPQAIRVSDCEPVNSRAFHGNLCTPTTKDVLLL
jgi:hypothetical protein